jgi:hypothetical protein
MKKFTFFVFLLLLSLNPCSVNACFPEMFECFGLLLSSKQKIDEKIKSVKEENLIDKKRDFFYPNLFFI